MKPSDHLIISQSEWNIFPTKNIIFQENEQQTLAKSILKIKKLDGMVIDESGWRKILMLFEYVELWIHQS